MAWIAEEKDVQMVLNMGDNIYFTGPTDEFDPRFETRFEAVYDSPSLQIPWLTIAGNHDHFGNVTAEVEYTKHSDKWYFPALFYKKTVEFNGTHIDFVMIDTIELCGNTKDIQNAGFVDMLRNESHDPKGPVNLTAAEEQWTWLERSLEESSAEYVIVSGHYPVHSMSSHGPTECLRQRLDPLLKRFNVNAYFSGHDHTLQHFVYDGKDDHKIHYVVSGAASRADSSTKHIKGFSTENLKFHYPDKSWISWSPVSQLGFRKGGLIYAEFGHETARLDFFDKSGKPVYTMEIPTRKLPADTSKPSTANPFIEI
uniref:Tartrate-resistant acid phosphatase type 5 n=1 Tax=Caenorhabditis japonica TaxID=281687 RepID=A0A8R1HRR5_CAEJA